MKKKYYYILLIIVLCFFDQLTKYMVLRYFKVGETVTIINNFLRILFVKNEGVSFGMLNGLKTVIIAITIAIILYMIYDFIKNDDRIHLFSVSLIIAGAVGNLIDRFVRGYVIDFISFILFHRELSIFNMADSFITLGVLIYVYDIFRKDYDEDEDSSEE